MKNQVLSIEQMKHLKELGVDVSKGSMVCLFIDDDGNEVEWDLIERHGSEQAHYYFDDEYEYDNGEFGGWIPISPRFYDAETGYYDHSSRESCGLFTLQDVIELLPRIIVENNLFLDIRPNVIYSDLCISYMDVNTNETIITFRSDNIIYSAYEMLCWLAENGYLTKKEEGKEACHVCGKTDVELSECECCGELYCEDCSSIYNQFTQIDYNCCKPCSKRERE